MLEKRRCFVLIMFPFLLPSVASFHFLIFLYSFMFIHIADLLYISLILCLLSVTSRGV